MKNDGFERRGSSRGAAWGQVLCLCLLCLDSVWGLDFDRDIRPLLSDRCFKCHGPDEKQRRAKLRLDTEAGISAAGIVVAGKPGESELYARISSDDEDELMPPPDSGLRLKAGERELIRRWIAEGAKQSRHWAFRRLVKPQIPAVKNTNWVVNEIDQFVLARLEANGLQPSPPAPKNILLRRATFDLTGLPPTAAEVIGFVQDTNRFAYVDRVVNLLASRRYGERMAVEWMDAARYADSNGFLFDYERTMWPWRNWVIGAFNRNMPYSEFVVLQLAGDLVKDATVHQRIATGFNRNHPFTVEDGVIDEEFRLNYVADRVTTMGTVFLGLTLECARCHDHKFDPVSQKEFYQLSAFFNNLPESGVMPDNARHAAPAIATPSVGQLELIKKFDAGVTQLQREILRDDPQADALQKAWEPKAENYWTVIRPDRMGSVNGATMTAQPDHSILVTGLNPVRDRHTFEFRIRTPVTLTGLRLEALQHHSMTNNGPGRSPSGTAILNHVQVARLDTNSNHVVILLRRADASMQHENFPIGDALKSAGNTGWGLPSGNAARRRSAVFELSEPTEFKPGDVLEVQLAFTGPYAQCSFGRVRFAATTMYSPGRLDPTGFVHELARLPDDKRSAPESRIVRSFFRTTKHPAYNRLHAQILQLEKRKVDLLQGIAKTMIMSEGVPRNTFVLERGRYDRPREKVLPDTPAHFPPMDSGLPRNRLGLAYWLTRPDHPLTARVFVNRVWHQLFGVGLVKTVEDFGIQGERPSHPELLDWLAADFVEHKWNVKRLILKIVTSATYRQSSVSSPAQLQRDPENRLLARGPRFRLSAEMIRDAALFNGGLLEELIGGPSVKPYQPANLWKRLTNRERFRQVYVPGTGRDLYRRSLYTYWRRALHPPNMAAFDAPNREVCVFRRRVTNTPQQTLVLLHDPQFVEAARALAQRMLTEAEFGQTAESRIRHAFLMVTSRHPDAPELTALRQYLRQEQAQLKANPDEVLGLLEVGASARKTHGREIEHAAYMMIARIIMNLGESITRN